MSQCLCLCGSGDGLLLSCFNFVAVVVLKGVFWIGCFSFLSFFLFFFLLLLFFLVKCNILTRTLLTF